MAGLGAALLLFWGSYRAASTLYARRPERAAAAALATFALLAAIPTALGALGMLYPVPLLLSGLACGGLLHAAPLFMPRTLTSYGARRAHRWMALVAAGWIAFTLVGAALLPVRGWDSLSYHLTPVYLYLQEGGIVPPPLHPLSWNAGFAFPKTGSIVNVWFALCGSVRFVDFTTPLLLLGCAPAILMTLGLMGRPKGGTAAFAAFALAPVTLSLAATNYVDITGCFLLLSGVAFALHFAKSGKRASLALAVLSAALLPGVKYGLVPLALVLLAWLVRHAAKRGRLWVLLVTFALALPVSGCWYVYSWLWLGNPLYDLGARPAGPLFYHYFFADWKSALAFPFRDLGLGSYNGGFGLLYWFVALPAAVVLPFVRRVNALPLLLALVSIGTFVVTPGHIRADGLRLALPALAMCSLYFGWLAAGRLRLWAGVVALAAFAHSSLIVARLPEQNRTVTALSDLFRGETRHPWEYYDYQFGEYVPAWRALDGWGATVRAYAPDNLLAPLFGRELQNRVVFETEADYYYSVGPPPWDTSGMTRVAGEGNVGVWGAAGR